MYRLQKTPEGFFRVLELPTEEELEQFYTDQYYQEEQGSYRRVYEQSDIDRFSNKLDKKIGVLKDLLIDKPENMLDVGCGEGWALQAFHDAGWDVRGLDYTERACVAHNLYYADRVMQGEVCHSLEMIRTAGERYQVVLLDNMLEHARDPYRLLELCRGAMKPDGVLIVEVPNEHSVLHQELLDTGQLKYSIAFKYPDHLSYFNIEGLRGIAKWAGLKEYYIVDFSEYSFGVRGRKVSLNKYIDRFPARKTMAYYALLADLGFGPELLGFFGHGNS